MLKNTNTEQNIQVVYIEGFNPENKTVFTVSKAGGRITIPIPLINGIQRIPKTGENWIVRRFDSTNWFFEGRYSDISYGDISEGDVIIESQNYLHIYGKRFFLNDGPIGTAEVDEFDLQNSTNTVALSFYPLEKTIQAFNNGLLIAPSSIVIDKKNLIFSSSLSVGMVVVYYQKGYDA